MINFFFIILIFSATFLNLLAIIALIKARDIFAMVHIVMIFNCYIVPICLLAIEMYNFTIFSILKIVVIGIFNVVIANIICHLVIQKATSNKIEPDAEAIN